MTFARLAYLLNDERRYAMLRLFARRVRLGVDDEDIGIGPVRNPKLAAIQHVIITFEQRWKLAGREGIVEGMEENMYYSLSTLQEEKNAINIRSVRGCSR